MSNVMKTPIGLDGFIQICLVVTEIEKKAALWASMFNVPVPEIMNNPARENPDETYRGQVATYGIKMAIIDAGSFVIELIEPDANPSTFKEFLDTHGEGVHHLGFEVGEKRDAIIAELESMGEVMRTIGYYPGSSWTIVDSEKSLGVNLNIKPVR